MPFKTPQKKLESNRRWRKNNPERFKLLKERWKNNNLERYRELQRNWEIKNSEKRKINYERKYGKRKLRRKINKENKKKHKKEYNKNYYQENKKRHRVWTKSWAKNNKKKVNEYARKRKIKKRGVHEVFSFNMWKEKLIDTQGICPNCKENIGIDNLTIDHTPPISKVPKGFVYFIKDVSPLCLGCNSSKGNKY